MAAAWSDSMSTFFAETKLDLTFEEGIFWITTRTIDCSYCMGHVEMGWELAGLTSSEIDRRIRLLAGDDWSSFPPAEQRAYAFARKLTKAPWTVSDDDIEVLKRDFGPDRAVVVVWAACRCNYMTRVSNGFQFSLERGNIFRDYFQKATPRKEAGRERTGQ
jgi:alkylhydroperoxidase family enzyme